MYSCTAFTLRYKIIELYFLAFGLCTTMLTMKLKAQDVSKIKTYVFISMGLTKVWHQPCRNYRHFHTQTPILA